MRREGTDLSEKAAIRPLAQAGRSAEALEGGLDIVERRRLHIAERRAHAEGRRLLVFVLSPAGEAPERRCEQEEGVALHGGQYHP